jgi:putative FmdB family regulatory protein
MPHYEFFCHNCKKIFEKIMGHGEYEESDVICPRCGSKRVEQTWSAFYANHLQEERMNARQGGCYVL